jgi:hypothetical protein
LSPLYQLFSSALPRKIVGTLGTIKVLLPSYPVNKCILSQNKEDIDTFRQFYLVTEHKLPLLSNCWLFRVAAHYLLRASNDIFYWRDSNLSPVLGTSWRDINLSPVPGASWVLDSTYTTNSNLRLFQTVIYTCI